MAFGHYKVSIVMHFMPKIAVVAAQVRLFESPSSLQNSVIYMPGAKGRDSGKLKISLHIFRIQDIPVGRRRDSVQVLFYFRVVNSACMAASQVSSFKACLTFFGSA